MEQKPTLLKPTVVAFQSVYKTKATAASEGFNKTDNPKHIQTKKRLEPQILSLLVN
jgi:hypothetical protein